MGVTTFRGFHWRWFPYVGPPKEKGSPFWLVMHWGYRVVLFGKVPS